MNQFKHLDSVFPCGKDRTFGEVVNIGIHVYLDGTFRGDISWKRKAWYVNASVNAWHLHRGLCRELRDLVSHQVMRSALEDAKKELAYCVYASYWINSATHTQGFSYSMDIRNGRTVVTQRVFD